MRKALKWTGIALLTPVVLMVILAALLYLPPIQNWVVQRVATYASEQTGMDISVERVRLAFPLDLSLEGVRVLQPSTLHPSPSTQKDTILDVRRAVADVQFWPLLKGNIVLDDLQLHDARVDTRSFIGDMRLQGTIGQLQLSAPGISQAQMLVELRQPRLSDTDLTIYMSDTAAVDTSTVGWRIGFDRFRLERTHLTIVSDSAARFTPATSYPPSTLHPSPSTLHPSPSTISAYMGEASISQGDIDLGLGRYAFGPIDWEQGALSIDSTLALSQVSLGLDSLYSYGDDLRVGIRHGSLVDGGSGLQLTRLQGAVAMDGEGLRITGLEAATPHSTLQATANIALSSLIASPSTLSLQASLGRDDALLLLPQLPADLLPDLPLTLQAQLNGRADSMQVEQLRLSLPTAFEAEASGTVGNLLQPDQLLAQLQLRADAQNLDPLLRHMGLPGDYRLPAGLKLSGELGAHGGSYDADLLLRDGSGSASLKGSYSTDGEAYSLNSTVSDLDLHRFMPTQPIGSVSAQLQLSGRGTNPFSPASQLTADVRLGHLYYDKWLVDSVQLSGSLADGHALLTATSNNTLVKGSADIDARLTRNTIEADINARLPHVDLLALGLDGAPVVGMNGTVKVRTDQRLSHYVSAHLTQLTIRDSVKTHHPEDLGLLVNTSPDTTKVRLQSGDLIVKLDASGSYEELLGGLTTLADTLVEQNRRHTIDQPLLKSLLPTAKLTLSSRQGNPLSDILLASTGISFRQLDANISSSPESGLNGDAYLLGLDLGDMPIDTLRLSLVDKGTRQTFNGQLTNNRRNPMGAMNILYDGQLHEHGARIGVRYFDARGRENVRIGAQADMVEGGTMLRLMPTKPTLGCKEFTLNDDNFLLVHNDMRVEANIDLQAADGTHLKIYSEDQDTTLLQDLTVSAHQLNLDELTANISLLPNLGGTLEGDFHLMMDQQNNISVASDMRIDAMDYEGSYIGNLGSEFVYLLREDGTHVVDASLLLDDAPIGTLQGSLSEASRLDATLQLDSMPLGIINGFMPDQLLGFEGSADGTLSVQGPMETLKMNGLLRFSNGYLVSNPYGMRMRFGDVPLQMTDSKLTFNQFALYADNTSAGSSLLSSLTTTANTAASPLTINGTIDLGGTGTDAVNLRLGARNFQLINARQKRESVAYGRMFVNIFARLTGNLSQLKLRGRLDVLGSTDLNYILLDSPLSTDNQMDELVRFTDFTDTTRTAVRHTESDALDLDVQLSIDQGAHVRCALNAEQSNYVDLLGGGDLRMAMNADGLTLRGRYTVESGTMKYSLPVIPLKTFSIRQGSYVEFNGQPDNPTLNITATERQRAQVASGAEGAPDRNVNFECGVVISRTLADMGLQFTIDAPEDYQIQNELQSMGTEQRGKLAVTMLTTGMYLADGNTSSFSMNNALSSFLQNEINNITAGALKTVDLQLGLDNSTDATGQTRTDYSFRFAKRFWNNRLSVQLGGKVSTGAEVEGQQQSFFDNVTMEYRLTPTGNQYVKLFYKQNVYDWLEGYTGEYGAGYIWKKKLGGPKQPLTPTPPQGRGSDSSATSASPTTSTTSNNIIGTDTLGNVSTSHIANDSTQHHQ